MDDAGNNPKHIGIILDGNRRFAKKLMMKPWMGHEWGARKLEAVLDWCKELDVRELTLYTFSTENFNRPKEEFDFLMELFRKEFLRLKDDPRLEKYGIRIRVIGRLHLFPQDVQDAFREIIERTKNYSNYTINFAMAYGGRAEIADAARKLAEDLQNGKIKPGQVNEETFANYLYMKDEPDMIIRTGGDKRTSNFLIWQGAYSEWFFLEKTWPEFEKDDLLKCIDEFRGRERRFGK